MHSLAVPSKQAGIGTEKHAVGGRRNPDLRERALIRRNLIQHRDILQSSSVVGREIAEITRASYPDPPRLIHRERADRDGRSGYPAPRRSVELENIRTAGA